MTRVIKNALLVCLLAASAFAADNIPTNVPSANPKERNALDQQMKSHFAMEHRRNKFLVNWRAWLHAPKFWQPFSRSLAV